jgi:anti-sigma regulatory factor (Ser/Thr protein kinase)
MKNTNFLRELIKDFKKHAIQDDDTTVFAITKHSKSLYKKIYEETYTFSNVNDLDEIIYTIDADISVDDITRQKFYIVFQEIFLNIFEHAYRENYDKQEIIKNNKKFNNIYGKLHIKLYKNDKYFYIIIKDEGKGFDVSNVLKLENKINFKRYHRRGLLLLLNIVSGLFFENNGRCAHIYIRREDGN